jgi:hypothetical protein
MQCPVTAGGISVIVTPLKTALSCRVALGFDRKPVALSSHTLDRLKWSDWGHAESVLDFKVTIQPAYVAADQNS